MKSGIDHELLGREVEQWIIDHASSVRRLGYCTGIDPTKVQRIKKGGECTASEFMALCDVMDVNPNHYYRTEIYHQESFWGLQEGRGMKQDARG